MRHFSSLSTNSAAIAVVIVVVRMITRKGAIWRSLTDHENGRKTVKRCSDMSHDVRRCAILRGRVRACVMAHLLLPSGESFNPPTTAAVSDAFEHSP